MKFKNIQFSIILSTIVLLSSCEDQLDLTPAQSVDQEIALNSDANIKRVLIGAYANIEG